MYRAFSAQTRAEESSNTSRVPTRQRISAIVFFEAAQNIGVGVRRGRKKQLSVNLLNMLLLLPEVVNIDVLMPMPSC